jgi:hypothetical protein
VLLILPVHTIHTQGNVTFKINLYKKNSHDTLTFSPSLPPSVQQDCLIFNHSVIAASNPLCLIPMQHAALNCIYVIELRLHISHRLGYSKKVHSEILIVLVTDAWLLWITLLSTVSESSAQTHRIWWKQMRSQLTKTRQKWWFASKNDLTNFRQKKKICVER